MAVLNVSAIIVTRGDLEDGAIDDIFATLPAEWEKIEWNNGERTMYWHPSPNRYVNAHEAAVYGRYAAIEYAQHDWIYVQDDDCVLPLSSLDELMRAARNHDSGGEPFVVCNMPAAFRARHFYDEHSLVGFGAVFHRDAPEVAFSRFEQVYPTKAHTDFFDRTADIVFTGLSQRVLVDVPYEDLPWASAENRMWKQPTHVPERTAMMNLMLEVRRHDE